MAFAIKQIAGIK